MLLHIKIPDTRISVNGKWVKYETAGGFSNFEINPQYR